MKVCLIFPTAEQDLGFWPPLGLGYIASFLLKKGHSLKILDRNILMLKHRNNLHKVDEATIKALKDFAPQLVGISATTPLITDAYRVAKFSKEMFPDVPVVLGGPHSSVLSQETLEECSDIDIVVRGEGEYTMSELADGKNLCEIDGITFRDNHDLFANEDRAPIGDLDVLPPPARDLLDMDFYLKNRVSVIRGLDLKATHIFTIRGCPYKCSFCASQAVFKGKVRFHSLDYVLREVEHLISDYRIEGLYFAEDIFLVNRQRIEELCRRFITERINRRLFWAAQLRANEVDEEILQLMKKAGCIQVEYGFESGSARILEIMHKLTSREDNLRAARLTKRVGLRMLSSVIVGTPGETEEDLFQTIEFLKAIEPDQIGFCRFIPLPGSVLFKMLKDKGLIQSNWINFNINNSPDPKLNFTQIKTERLFVLFEDFNQEFVLMANLKNSLIANLKLHPFRLLSKACLSLLNKPRSILSKVLKFLRK